MDNWHKLLLKRFKRAGLYLLLPLLVMITLIRVFDAARAPVLPDHFSSQQLHTIDGKYFSLAELSEKKPLLVFFWNRWCGACHDTLPFLISLNGKRTSVLTVASGSGDDISIVRYLNGHHYTVPVVNDSSGSLAAEWDIGVMPTLLVIAKGEVVSSSSGWTSNIGIRLRLWWARKWQF